MVGFWAGLSGCKVWLRVMTMLLATAWYLRFGLVVISSCLSSSTVFNSKTSRGFPTTALSIVISRAFDRKRHDISFCRLIDVRAALSAFILSVLGSNRGTQNTTSENCNDNSPSSKDVATCNPSVCQEIEKGNPDRLSCNGMEILCWLAVSMSILLIWWKDQWLSINQVMQ